MRAVQVARVEEDEIPLEVSKEIHTGHSPAREEGLRHPPVVLLEVVRCIAVAENVDEQETLGCEPGRDFCEECRVGFHVLEHFDGEDVSESTLIFEIVYVDVAGDDLDILVPLLGGHTVDVELLCSRVGEHGDGGEWVVLSEASASPSAPMSK